VVINELLTDNESASSFPVQDPDYAPDYIELQNLTANAIDLGAGLRIKASMMRKPITCSRPGR
jgi:hypothetical protein